EHLDGTALAVREELVALPAYEDPFEDRAVLGDLIAVLRGWCCREVGEDLDPRPLLGPSLRQVGKSAAGARQRVPDLAQDRRVETRFTTLLPEIGREPAGDRLQILRPLARFDRITQVLRDHALHGAGAGPSPAQLLRHGGPAGGVLAMPELPESAGDP